MVIGLPQLLRCNIRDTSRPRKWRGALVIIGAVFVSLSVALPNLAKSEGVPSSDPVWASSFKNLNGETQPLEQWKGKTVLIYFWATWCAPCHKEAPRLSALYEKYKDKGFVVIGLAVDNADKVRKFVADKALKNPTIYGGTDAIQLGRDLGNDLGAIPYTVIVDPEGTVVETIRGDTPDGKIEALISPLLG